jgi:hypothetical protein
MLSLMSQEEKEDASRIRRQSIVGSLSVHVCMS